MLYRFSFILLFLMPTAVSGYVDLNLGYSFSVRQINGVETESNPEPGSAQTRSTGYSANIAWFVWEYTALEFNFSHTTENLIDDRAVTDGSITILKVDSTVITQVQGFGIRQAFASRKSRIIPSLSIGYAQFTTSGDTVYTLNDGSSEADLTIQQDQEVFSSSYASFSLRFRLTQLMGFTVAAKTVMPDFEVDQAEDNITYTAGLSWIF
ncbi:MAG: hypothetical protein CME65_01795 [Halobacteriovoraceae bacterium]|nr:hypothetical protein [Halobacteriovoraceae bacterium]